MASRLLVFLVLAVAFAAPVAAASFVPDPTWIGGLYDGGDGDEAVVLVWESAGVLPPVAVLVIVALVLAAIVRVSAPRAILTVPAALSRGPPLR